MTQEYTRTQTRPPNRTGPNWFTVLTAGIAGFMAGIILILVCVWPSDRTIKPQTLDIPVEISATVQTPDANMAAPVIEWPEIAPWERADPIDIHTGEPQAKKVGGDPAKPYGFAEVTP